MKLASPISGFFLLITLLYLMPFTAWAGGENFVFSNYEAVSMWRFENVSEARITGKGLLLKGNNFVKIAPPTGFQAPLRRVVMELRFKTLKSFVTNASVRASDGWEAVRSVRVKVLDGSDGVTHMRIYFGKHKGGGTEAYISDFAVEFYSTENIAVRLDSLRLYEPTGLELVSILWEEFWRPDFITRSIVGFVATPAAGDIGFMTMLYVLTAITFAVALAFYRFSRRPLDSRRVSKALVLILIAAGFIFTVRMDYNWLTIWRDDVKTLSGVKVEEKIRIVNNRDFDSFFDFINFIKGSVPPGRAIRPAVIAINSPMAAIARYYMLPLKESGEADFLWSYGEVLRLDPRTGALYDEKGKLIVPRAALFAQFAKNAAIYEVIK